VAQKKTLPNPINAVISYDELSTAIDDESISNKVKAVYINTYLKKSKSESNWQEMVNGYYFQIYNAQKELQLKYADSAIAAAIKTKSNSIISSAYLTKGILHYCRHEHIKALDYYLVANKFISETDDKYLQHKTTYMIAQTKYYLGYYHEAIEMLNECLKYFEDEDKRAYLNTLHSVSLCYNKLGKYNLSSKYIANGLKVGNACNNHAMKLYFLQVESNNQYGRREYTESLNNLRNLLPKLIKEADVTTQTVSKFYIARNLIALNQDEKALPYLEKVDKAMDTAGVIIPELRANYELLINYYKKKKDHKSELYYIKRLLKADSILNKNYYYLSKRIHKEYDTQRLLSAKAEIEKSLQIRKTINTFLMVTIVVLIIALYNYVNRQKIYKRKFYELMAKSDDEKESEPEINKEQLDINPETVAATLQKLEVFESKKKFLDPEMSLTKIASYCNCNPKYVSKIIYHYRHKKFIDYINDLRIDYIIKLIKNDHRYRNYKMKSLAEESGFKTAQHFTKAFLSRTGISATFFINQVNSDFKEFK
jgi:AraC-like DNA-binding protein